MASTIKLKNGSGAPLASDLVQGEPAFDLTNKRLYTENASGTVIEVGTNPSSLTTSSADINGGTIDGTVIGGSSAAAGSFTTISASGEIAANGGVAFGDNDKATFGASDDLQIYHDGTVSLIKNSAGSSLTIADDDGDIRIQAKYGENSIYCNNDGQVELYYDNAEKLATTSTGIDVTGDITLGDTNPTITFNDSSVTNLSHTISSASDNLRIMADVNGVDASSRVEIFDGTTEVARFEAGAVDVTGTVTADGLNLDGNIQGDTGQNMQVSAGEGTGDKLDLRAGDDVRIYVDGATSHKLSANFANNGDISFYEDTGTTAKFFWDASAESLGIGTTSPAARLDLGAYTGGLLNTNILAAQDGWINVKTSSAVSGSRYEYGGSGYYGRTYANAFGFNIDTDTSAVPIIISTNGSERMRIDSSGRVGIGTSSPSSILHISSSTPKITLTDSGVDRTSEVYAASDNLVLAADTGDAGADSHIRFEVDTSEKMRIDSSGNLLVGKTSTTLATAGAEIRADGFIRSTVSNATCLQVNRITGTGTAIDLRYDGTSVGSIVVTASATAYNTSSDYRLKENVVSMDNASDRVLALNPVRFNFIADPDKTVDGFLAHEAQAVVPEAVTGSKDAMRTEEYEVSPAVYEDVIIPAVEEVLDEEGNVITEAQPEQTEQRLVSEAIMGTREVPDYQGIDQSKLVPLLTKALQEALQRIEALEAKLA